MDIPSHKVLNEASSPARQPSEPVSPSFVCSFERSCVSLPDRRDHDRLLPHLNDRMTLSRLRRAEVSALPLHFIALDKLPDSPIYSGELSSVR